MSEITRREALQRGGVLAGALTAASLGWAAAAQAADEECGDFVPELTPERYATYAAVVAALAGSSHSPLTSDDVMRAPAALDELCAEYGENAQVYLCLLLDELRLRERPAITDLPPGQTLERLRKWSRISPPTVGGPTRDERRAHCAALMDSVRRDMLRNGGARTAGRTEADRPHASVPGPPSPPPPLDEAESAQVLFGEAVQWAERAVVADPPRGAPPAVTWR